MATHFEWFCISACIFMLILSLQARAHTNDLEAQTLRDMYIAFNSPSQLKNWRVEGGGDPCEESWTGVRCSGSSVIEIKLQRLNLTGALRFKLSNLRNLKHLDLSYNEVHGEIPLDMPRNLKHLNLACNKFRNNIPFPYSSTDMNHLTRLNLSHNMLSGPLGDFFGGLKNLKMMDLSANNFRGDIPSSFAALKSLKFLFLQHNSFTGSILHLTRLPLYTLDLENNHFSGAIPKDSQKIKNFWIFGNDFHAPPEGVPKRKRS